MRSWKDCYAKFVPEEYLNKDNRYNAFDFRRAHLNLIDEKGYEMWLAKSAGTPVGVAIFGSDLEDHGRGKIQALYVDPDWQCRHVGTRQLDAVLDQLDYPVVVVDCVTQNEGGCSFWERRGFRPIGEGPSFPIEGYGDVDTVRYVLVRSAVANPPSEA